MTLDAVVMAAGEGTRLRPLTERWAKAVLPIDGRPVVSTLLHELSAAGVARVWLVTGHLAEQVEALVGDGGAFGVEVRTVHQPRPDGSADALRRALDAGARPPLLLSAADTVFARDAIAAFARSFGESEEAGAIAVRRQAGRPEETRIRVEDGRVAQVVDTAAAGGFTAAPLMALDDPLVAEIHAVCEPPFQPPYEVAVAFQRAIDAGATVLALETGPTRDLTHPLDLVEENFPYLQGLERDERERNVRSVPAGAEAPPQGDGRPGDGCAREGETA
jgi:dTDP-glucose pyrophosphorylase